MRRTTINTNTPWWLNLTSSIVGFDGEGEGAGGDGGSGDGTGEGAGDGQGSGGAGDGGNSTDDDTAGLKTALQKERESRKAMERELKALKKADEARTSAEKTEIERATEAEKKTSDKVARLAKGFRDNAVNSAILEAAKTAKFRDPSDALRPEVLSAIGVEQDEDDPSKVEIDKATVTEAIKQLAKSKPHYLNTDNSGSGAAGERKLPRSGSTFGGSNNNGQQPSKEQQLAARYPALRNRI